MLASAADVEFRILGALEVLDEGKPVAVEGQKQRALLAVLLLHANEVVSTDRLLDELWGEEPPATGSTALRVRISQLRKALGRNAPIVTRAPGYSLRVGPGEFDLHRFERLLEEGRNAEPSVAAAKLREALALWRGEPLADFAYEPFAQPAIGRLSELRLVALERRIEADLALGRDAELAAELHPLIDEHPLRERLREYLMLALYRSGRQVEALEAYQDARRALVEELGVDPSPGLRELERAILRQDSALELEQLPSAERAILVVPQEGAEFEPLLTLAEPLARQPVRALILARVVRSDELTAVNALLGHYRTELRERGATARVAAFTSDQPSRDLVRLATEQDVDLVLLAGTLTPAAEALFREAPCDVALLLEHEEPLAVGPDRPILVPFGGADHDWAAVELAAWIARAQEAPLHLAGSSGRGGGGDASRLLASASLIVQRVAGITVVPALVDPGEKGLRRATAGTGLVVFGLPAGWREKGLGNVRASLIRNASTPILLVRKGLRPGGLAPEGSHTRFTWTLRG